MFEKTKEFVSKHRRICTGICMAIPAGIAFYAAYRAGCQHGVGTVQRVLRDLDYDLCEQVDHVFQKNGVF